MKISKIIESQLPESGFPMRGVNGYAGEQDGDTVVLSDLYLFSSRAAADEQFPSGVPEYVELHWGQYRPGHGWECVFGWWASQEEEENKNPLSAPIL